mgnify:CR=1 FL=1
MSKLTKKPRNQKQCTLSFKVVLNGDESSDTGQLIEFLNSKSSSKNRIAINTLEARFLPLLLDKEDPLSMVCALDCLGKLEGFKQAIISYYGLEASHSHSPVYSAPHRPTEKADTSQDSPNHSDDLALSESTNRKRQERLSIFSRG